MSGCVGALIPRFLLPSPPTAPSPDRPLEKVDPSHLPGLTDEQAAKALVALVEHSVQHDVSTGIHASSNTIFGIPWIHKLIPGIEKLAAAYHIGNFVAIRGTKEQVFEAMPLYARIGMHLLFHGSPQAKILRWEWVQDLLKEQSVKQGEIYDSPESIHAIPSFIETYSISTAELLEPDITKYPTFNQFFFRKLKSDARPVANASDPTTICSAADCRLSVYPTMDLARAFWVKGREFTIPALLDIPLASKEAYTFDGSSVAIFRLAPADYHRFHCPIDGKIGHRDFSHKDIPGQYYTVNPQAVGLQGFDVFTANRRSVHYLSHAPTGLPVAFVAIGALLVGSVVWTHGSEDGAAVKKGDEIGYFAYGGSTVVVVFPRGVAEFDADLVENSLRPLETLVKVGESIGQYKPSSSCDPKTTH
ncbi:hypothetical protein MKEN_01080700 [Mycena kentingensis (nom. inval.)]|nr:hypothetical protein MKEN_01080700 [Mycena kentingensis (nom. inval.)]